MASASPRSPADAAVNSSTPQTTKRYETYEVRTFTTESTTPAEQTQTSSPFVSCVSESNRYDQENVSPSKAARNSRVLSGAELSPLKILAEQRSSSADNTGNTDGLPLPAVRSPRKMSPEKRFPVKVSEPGEAPRVKGRTISLEQAVQENDGLKHAIEIFEDEQSVVHNEADASSVTNAGGHEEEGDEAAGPDDTMVSTFSTFSAVPNMAMLARLGHSPTKLSSASGPAPRGRPDPSPSRTPRPAHPVQEPGSGNTTSLLMDFNEQLRSTQKSPSKRGNLPSSRTAPSVAATPSRPYGNLIDFDIPPMPTPRSVPSITPRELESLKSNFLSEICSLKASLSGKEAEVQSLKSAVGDAEKRVGESMEQLHEERSLKDQLAADKESWENRGREMESVLRKVKGEIVLSQREREELEQKLDESEKRREAAEMMHQEAESKMAGMRAGKDSEKSSPDKAKSPGPNREVEMAVERVARDLHALYKSKHETKVAALKKSYEGRWEKKVRELETRIEELSEDNERLRVGRDATMTRVEPGSAEAEERKARAVKDSAAIRELTADVQRLEAVATTVQHDNEQLRGMLEQERVEKGELVQLAEEMMSMQSFVAPRQQQQDEAEKPEAVAKTPKAATTVENLRSSIRGGSGLRAPGTGLRAPNKGVSGGLPRPGGMARSGIMSSIEKMGSYRGRAAE